MASQEISWASMAEAADIICCESLNLPAKMSARRFDRVPIITISRWPWDSAGLRFMTNFVWSSNDSGTLLSRWKQLTICQRLEVDRFGTWDGATYNLIT